MTKNEITGQVLLRASGGLPTSDISVREWDIKSYIPAAINYAIIGDYWGNIERDGEREIPNDFVAEFSFDSVTEENGIEYLPFDKKIVNIPGNQGIRFVMDDCGNSYAPRAAGVSKKCYWDKVLVDNLEYTFIGKKIKLFGRPPLATNFTVGVVLDASEMGDDDDLNIPAGKEPEVIDI